MAYQGFPRKLLAAVVCPKEGSSLSIHATAQSADGEHLWEGRLRCRECGAAYSIEEGIISLLDGQAKLPPVLEQEREERDRRADDYDRMIAARFYKEVLATEAMVGEVKGKRIIEYAAGTGRFTEIFAREADSYLALDFSRESLRIAGRKISAPGTGLVLADAVTCQTAPAFFDAAFTFQFFGQIPSREARQQFCENVQASLRSGGSFVCSAYHQELRRLWRGAPPEGFRRSGIFYHFFSVVELRQELSVGFVVEAIRPIDITLPFERRLGLPPALGGALSRLAERIPFLNRFGHIVIARARKGP